MTVRRVDRKDNSLGSCVLWSFLTIECLRKMKLIKLIEFPSAGIIHEWQIYFNREILCKLSKASTGAPPLLLILQRFCRFLLGKRVTCPV